MRATLTALIVLSTAASAAAQTTTPEPMADWSRVSRLSAGTVVGLRPDNARTRKVTIIAADDFGVTVLKMPDNSVPSGARDYIRETYQNAPGFFTDPANRSFEDPKRGVKLSAAGVTVSGQKVADWSAVVQRVPRDSVIELTTRDSVKDGFLSGFLGAAAIYGGACAALRCRGPEAIGVILGGSMTWGLIGLAFDAANGEATLYARPDNRPSEFSIAPIAGAGRKGAMFSVKF